MNSPHLESREELLEIIRSREIYDKAHRRTDFVYCEKFSLSKMIDEHPKLFISSIAPVLSIVISLFFNHLY
jgi:hypothetical protein